MKKTVNETKKPKVKQKLSRVVSNNWFIAKLFFKECPFLTSMYMLELFKGEFFIFIEHTFGIAYVLECAEEGRPFVEPMIFLIGLTIALFITQIFGGYVWHRAWLKATPRIKRRLKSLLYEKAREIDLECYDNPDYYNNFILSLTEADNAIERTANLIKVIIVGVTAFVSTGVFVLLKDWQSIFIALISFVISFLFAQALNRVNYRVKLARNPAERKRSYISRVFYLADYCKEIRLNPNAKTSLYSDFDKANDEITHIEKKNAKKRVVLSFGRDSLSNLLFYDIFYMSYLVFKAVVLGTLSCSSVVVLYNNSYRLRNGLMNIMQVFPLATESSLYVEKIREFLSYKPKIVSEKNLPVSKEPQSLKAENITFSYNEKMANTINGISFDIKPHEKIALVGYNGAGKTTLIKLLMRLYDPTSGTIRFGEKDIRDYDVEQYRENIGAVFQDYKLFAATVAENITLDTEKGDLDRLNMSIDHAGFRPRFELMQKGFDTPLTAEFEDDGVNLSGGESQKLAIARVFYKECGLIILDEPSSALDPIAEYQLNKYMLDAAKDKTVIFISHRLSTTRQADRIFMLENGRIIESGSHKELVSLNGKYAEMWNAQARYYIEK